jgi:hypothetical protein
MKNYHPGRVQSKITDGIREVEVVQRTDGKNALAVDSRTTIDQVFGRDPLPDSYFTILNTGVAGNTWTLDIAATSKDPTSPDRDIPAYQKIFTVQAGEVGDEIALRDRMISELQADSTFKNTCFLEAQAPAGDLRAIVHITSTEFSLSGEFVERPNAGDFDVNVTGSADVDIAFDNLIARGKPTSLARDPNNPHRIGILGISGSVITTPGELGDIFFEHAENLGSQDLLVDGSTTPVVFTVTADATRDIFVERLRFHGIASSIKFQQFLAIATLSTGIGIEIKSDDKVITLVPNKIKNTEDFFAEFALGSKTNELYSQPSAHMFISDFTRLNPFPLRVQGEFATDDYIKVTINDDLTSTSLLELEFQANGFYKEP